MVQNMNIKAFMLNISNLTAIVIISLTIKVYIVLLLIRKLKPLALYLNFVDV